jgi:hypothetical protein
MDLGFNAFRHNKIKDHINRALHEANGLALSKLNELGGSGEPDGYNGLTDPPPKLRSNDMKEENPCWKGYKQLGMKKKGAKKVPNCVSVEEDGPVMSRYTERPTYEGNDKYPDTAERGIYEGWASIGHAYDWAGDRNSKAKFYGKKPKPTTTKNDEKDDTYKDSKQGGKVKFAKTVKEEKKPKPVKLTPKQEQDKTIPSSMAYYREKIYQARLKQLRKEETQIDELKAETLGSYIKKASASRKAALTGPKADVATWGKRQKGITTAIKQLTKENSKDKDWDAATGFAEQVPSHLHLNKPDTKYAPGAAGITHTIHEETKMDNKPINEAIENIMEDNLGAMKENLMVALQEKAIEKLEERKKEIAAQYFAQ